ncbi:MAG: 30S ribosomal protein S4 [Chloroflexi bacterium]|nr:30S ribosomal protein S4 [Chloroflexota bacterium]
MARYTGPVCKLCRREGMKLFLKGERCLTPKCSVERRGYPPGMHGQRRARKVSEYGLQLREKQKMRRVYGVLERQFRRTYAEAERTAGATGDNLIKLLERRLDNVVYRLGFADSRAQARQLVRHGHFTVNGRRTDIPSFSVKPSDVIAVREGSRKREYFQTITQQLTRRTVAPWLSLDTRNLSARVVGLPEAEAIDAKVNPQLIVEFYSR